MSERRIADFLLRRFQGVTMNKVKTELPSKKNSNSGMVIVFICTLYRGRNETI